MILFYMFNILIKTLIVVTRKHRHIEMGLTTTNNLYFRAKTLRMEKKILIIPVSLYQSEV